MKKFVKRLLVMLTAAVLVTAGTVPAKAAERGLATKEDTTPISRRSTESAEY